MTKKALILSHLGLGGISNIAPALKAKGYDLLVVSSKPCIDINMLEQAWQTLGVDSLVLQTPTLNCQQILAELGESELKSFDFCLSVWEGQRMLMAEINALIGANDISAHDIATSQNKFTMRNKLYELGLSSTRAFLIRELNEAKAQFANHKFVVKPARSAGGLQTRIVDNLDNLRADDSLSAENDLLFAEYYHNNWLYLEPFIEGEEFSFEVIMHHGERIFACEHEKVGVAFAHNTILETGLASPAVSVGEAHIELGIQKCDAILRALNLNNGCFHVEFKYFQGQWELIEINPRIGGSLIYDSVKRQFDYCLLQRWAESLCGIVPTSANVRLGGSYFQIAYAQPDQQIQDIRQNAAFPEPNVCQKLLNIGDVADGGSREIFAAQSLWDTNLDSHQKQVRELNRETYLSYV